MLMGGVRRCRCLLFRVGKREHLGELDGIDDGRDCAVGQRRGGGQGGGGGMVAWWDDRKRNWQGLDPIRVRLGCYWLKVGQTFDWSEINAPALGRDFASNFVYSPILSKLFLPFSIMSAQYTNSIPTPPFSPIDDSVHSHLTSTINLLDSLVAFYQQERMWVYRTRAQLDGALHNNPQSSLPSPSSSSSHSPLPDSDPIKLERVTSPPVSPTQHSSRWVNRKKGFKLRLDGLSPKHRRTISSADDTELCPPKEHILDMFEKMMEARMESCQRVNRLVRNANRADLHLR